jgi:hypothetical protein
MEISSVIFYTFIRQAGAGEKNATIAPLVGIEPLHFSQLFLVRSKKCIKIPLKVSVNKTLQHQFTSRPTSSSIQQFYFIFV